MANAKKEKRTPTTVHLNGPNKRKLKRLVKQSGVLSGSDIINKLIDKEEE